MPTPILTDCREATADEVDTETAAAILGWTLVVLGPKQNIGQIGGWLSAHAFGSKLLWLEGRDGEEC